MELGEKLRRARLEAGLSQRQLCGGEITRNMLSLIENGSATPSMKTLRYLAERLGKNVSFFLEETAVVSPNRDVMDAARRLYDSGAYQQAAAALEDYQAPDAVYDREKELLWVLTHLALARKALDEKREIYARELLKKADVETAYCAQALKRQRLLLLGRLGEEAVSGELPSLDEELMLRAAEALVAGTFQRAERLLEAMEDHTHPRWMLLRGDLAFTQKNYRDALPYYHGAEGEYPRQTAPKLECCYRELEDYKRAYEYACKQKS